MIAFSIGMMSAQIATVQSWVAHCAALKIDLIASAWPISLKSRLPLQSFDGPDSSAEDRLLLAQRWTEIVKLNEQNRRDLVWKEVAQTSGRHAPRFSGRFACVFPLLSLWDGLSEQESQGLVDEYDIPGCMLWMSMLLRNEFFEEESPSTSLEYIALLVWVPNIWKDQMEKAVTYNCTNAIRWWADIDNENWFVL